MRRPLMGCIAALAVMVFVPANQAKAQVGMGVGADPFSFYYGYYLPHQAAMASQPRTIDTLNQVVATRQYSAQTDRTQLYDPISPYGDEDSDPLSPNARNTGRGAVAKPQSFGYGNTNSAINGAGPAAYYNRTARYFPALKPNAGRGPNRNLAVIRTPRGGGGGMGGMPSMPTMPR
jgi:hypothetical protein